MSAAGAARWYVVHTKPREERRALEHLERQQYRCYLPDRPVERLRQGRRIEATEPLFARYLFIRLDNSNSSWLPIRSTRGVSRMVQFGERFPALPEGLVETLQEARQKTRELFAVGERVVARSGPFSGVEAVYLEPDGDRRVMVLMEILGRDHKLSLPALDLRRSN
jgi:transcriptional antiterminator RfaH